MRFIIKHRLLGDFDAVPSETIITAPTKEDALQEFYESYEDLNYFIVSCEVLELDAPLPDHDYHENPNY